MSEATVAARGGGVFGIHALEALHVRMVERRFPAGSTARQGVKSVAYLEGDNDTSSRPARRPLVVRGLLETRLGPNAAIRNVLRRHPRQVPPVPPPGRRPTFATGPVAFLIEALDGLRADAAARQARIDDTTVAAPAPPQRSRFRRSSTCRRRRGRGFP